MSPAQQPLALVTGASRGIGCELASHLGERGYDLVINAEDHARLHQAAQKLAAVGGQGDVVQRICAATSVRKSLPPRSPTASALRRVVLHHYL
jgi:NAD(P)-dependent dehydrogenase (short-subunit alcohol dehydrogenase family)